MANVLPNTQITPDDDFIEVMECDYKGEHYSVRDNGTIMRHAKKRKRPNDNIWTFGVKNPSPGYMHFCGEAVHRIVASAFHGEAPSNQHVVDHIDTNHCNNRPVNLRWLTKLENILSNEITCAKVVHICGSIEAFLANPQLLFGHESKDPNFAWMKTVTREEASNALANLKNLQNRDTSGSDSKKGMGAWVYDTNPEQWNPNFSNRDKQNIPTIEQEKPYIPQRAADMELTNGKVVMSNVWNTNVSFEDFYKLPTRENLEAEQKKEEIEEESTIEFFETNHKLAVQQGWNPRSKPIFPCCPTKITSQPLQDYFNNLEEEKIFVETTYGPSTVYKFTIYEDKLLVLTKVQQGIKPFAFATISWNGEVFIHKSEGTFFTEIGALASYTIAQGQEWDGEDCIDFYCD